MITFIISSCDRPEYLLCCLASLACQSGDMQFIVTCNSRDVDLRQAHLEVARRFDAPVHFTVDEGAYDCYRAAEIVFEKDLVRGEWVGFPSDDSYYVPLFLPYMVLAAETNSWDFVYCDMLYTSKWEVPKPWHYSVMDVKPVRYHIDKTCFLMKSGLFSGFPGKRGGAPCEADGELAEELAKYVRHGKAEGGPLVVHN